MLLYQYYFFIKLYTLSNPYDFFDSFQFINIQKKLTMN